ncbi:MAG: Ca-activated chloride channel family protein [Crocinitomix sp.]|jgi:Ca-activated chloride channel family protein
MKTKKILITGYIASLIMLASCGGGDSGCAGCAQDERDNVMYDLSTETDDGYYKTSEAEDGMMMMEEIMPEDFNTEEYDYLAENDFLSPGLNPLSTFAIDVDNASYTNVRRMLNQGQKPPVDAVRTEEFINYFDYDYPSPSKSDIFSVYTEMGECPWNSEHQLMHVGLKGYTVSIEDLPPSNLVFLLDVSGSMNDENKLPLLKKSFKLMVNRLNTKDKVSIVTYAGDERVVLESTSCENKGEILAAIDNLSSGGSTNGEGGIEKAYDQAVENFVKNGNNRIILATDGDFNIGRSSGGELTRLIEEKRDLGVYLTILGFGMGNYKDSKMESLADHGNGNYFYIDDIGESNNVLVDNLAGTLFTIAKDVKIQVEFNPNFVSEYRLIGYENRLMNAADFADDKKDAGELGAGHTVTAIYEIIPGTAKTNDLKYQQQINNNSAEFATVKLRYKKPDENKSKLIELTVNNSSKTLDENSKDFRFSAAVAAFSLILRESQYMNNYSLEEVLSLAKSTLNLDDTRKIGFLNLVEKAMLIAS